MNNLNKEKKLTNNRIAELQARAKCVKSNRDIDEILKELERVCDKIDLPDLKKALESSIGKK